MSEMTDDQVAELHDHLTTVFVEFDQVCRALNIQYYLIGGSLLGAVRHHGIIPWDDDIDVAMLRPDYERFLRIAPLQIKNPYFLQTIDSDPTYYLGWAKFRMTGTKFVFASDKHANIRDAVNVDVFPLDNSPNHAALRYLHAIICRLLAVLARVKHHAVSPLPHVQGFRRPAYQLLAVFALPVRQRTLIKLLHSAMKISRNDNSKYVVNICSSYSYQQESWKRQCFTGFTEVEFEGHSAFAPARWHEVLVKLYGDYMSLPPEGERRRRHQILIHSDAD